MRLTASAGPALTMPDDQKVDDLQVFSHQPWDINTCPKLPDGTPYIPLAQAAGFQVRGAQCQPLIVRALVPGPGNTLQLKNFIPTFNSEQIPVPFVGDTGVQNSITYFARLQIDKSWNQWHALLSYSRSAENGSGLGTSTLVDSLIGQVTYQPTQDWTFTLNAFGTMQSAISEVRAQRVAVRPVQQLTQLQSLPNGQDVIEAVVTVPVPFQVVSGDKIDNPIDVKTYRVELRADRRIRRNLTAMASGSWYEQTNSGRAASNSRTEYRVVLGFTWTFDPIPLPLTL
jgi:hypothetical protein